MKNIMQMEIHSCQEDRKTVKKKGNGKLTLKKGIYGKNIHIKTVS